MSVDRTPGEEHRQAALSVLTLAADGPVPALTMSLFVTAWLAVSWLAASYLGPGAAAFVLMAGVLIFWLLVPKAPESSDLPRWTILPLGAAFIAGLFGAGYMSMLDEQLTAAGYGLWFVLWLQFGLWLKHRYGR